MSDAPRILLVDDDRHVVRFLKKALEDGGYAVTATTSSKQAQSHIEDHPPDLLILDLNMPEPDGFQLLKTERAKCPYLRILAISGYSQGALLEAAQILGAIATLQKPVTRQALLTKVREILGR